MVLSMYYGHAFLQLKFTREDKKYWHCPTKGKTSENQKNWEWRLSMKTK